MSQSAFADIFGITRASIGSYEEGRAEPKIDTIIQIAKHFGISLEQILQHELTVNELYLSEIRPTPQVRSLGKGRTWVYSMPGLWATA